MDRARPVYAIALTRFHWILSPIRKLVSWLVTQSLVLCLSPPFVENRNWLLWFDRLTTNG
jgi:hypothetical protein